MACRHIPSPETFAPGMLGFLDCQAQTLGMAGYQALAAPGAVGATMLTGMIALVIAFVGYRMLLGHVPTIRDGVLTFVKIGLVLTLAANWPAFQIVVYDVVLRGPAELMATIGGAAGLPGAGGGMALRLDWVDQSMKALAIKGVGQVPAGPENVALYPNVAPPPFLGFDTFALGMARVGFLVGAVGCFAVVRLAAGLLLALGPIFIAFLLFDGTRGLFEGWVKALLGAALASLATSIVLGVELALLEPWLADLTQRRADSLDILGAPAQLLATVVIFLVALAGVSFAVARAAFSLRVAAWFPYVTQADNAAPSRPALAGTAGTRGAPAESLSRAAAVAEAVAISQRREAGVANMSRATMIADGRAGSDARRGGITSGTGAPAPSSTAATQRRTARRLSARAGQRDRR